MRILKWLNISRQKGNERDPSIVIEVKEVHRSFGDGSKTVHVLQGLNLTVRSGEIIGLYGPSGSGKTTLLNLIGALDRPDSGSIEIDGKNIVKMRDGARTRLRRTKIGFIFQSSTLLATYTAAENIDLALRLPGLNYFQRRKRTKSALAAVGLGAWANHMPEEMSGGQRQRIAIARALAMQPAIILADEPTSGLDTRMSRRMMLLFRGIAEAQRTTFLVVSHDPVVIDYVDSAYDLHDGMLIQRDPAGVGKAVSSPEGVQPDETRNDDPAVVDPAPHSSLQPGT